MTACMVSLCNLCDASAVLYVNRATCYVRLQEWDQVEQECRQALSKEPAHMQVNIALVSVNRHRCCFQCAFNPTVTRQHLIATLAELQAKHYYAKPGSSLPTDPGMSASM